MIIWLHMWMKMTASKLISYAHIEIALDAMRTWGFKYTQLITWVKRWKSGKLQIGMGHHYRHAAEQCLFGVRGKIKAGSHSLPAVFDAPRTTHSTKPDLLLAMAEMMSPMPRLEMFARRRREGWTAYGDQLEVIG